MYGLQCHKNIALYILEQVYYTGKNMLSQFSGNVSSVKRFFSFVTCYQSESDSRPHLGCFDPQGLTPDQEKEILNSIDGIVPLQKNTFLSFNVDLIRETVSINYSNSENLVLPPGCKP